MSVRPPRQAGGHSQSNKKMLTVYAFSTPNSVKASIVVVELCLAYELRPVNIRKSTQKAPIT